MKQIRETLRRLMAERKRAVLATIIRVEGSAYRREGSRCLFTENGEIVGMLSGGCVEADVREHAEDVFATGRPKRIVYDFRSDSDDVWGMGAGCNGAITIWLELFDPVGEADAAGRIAADFEARLSADAPFISAMVVDSQAPYPAGYRLTADELAASLPLAEVSIGSAELRKLTFKGVTLTAFVERIAPAPSLYIVGAGPDAMLLGRAAHALDWKVTFIDHRTGEEQRSQLPNGSSWLQVPRGDFSGVPVHDSVYVVLMTHSIGLDIEAARRFLFSPAAYLGILGSRRRAQQIAEVLREEAGSIAADLSVLNKLHAPVGLDIGAQTPEEITLSVMSELLAVRGRRSGGSLRERLPAMERESMPAHR
ncbi:XdhC family protein [Paenibacillus humicola]|uniref:XdhC family protein n=1 Tax=Paenibacillus humicola TaxID=3110540 RepID=UPI00237A5F78|nr:XdhC family protein [Paenibacillus humicola]